MAQRKEFTDQFAPGQPDDCWEWTGSKSARGYGRFCGKWAHRLAFERAKGAIPDGLIVRHSCDNPGCVNPGHLIAGTHKENTADAIERWVKPQATKDFERLSFAKIARIKSNPKGLSEWQLAVTYAVNVDTVRSIRASR